MQIWNYFRLLSSVVKELETFSEADYYLTFFYQKPLCAIFARAQSIQKHEVHECLPRETHMGAKPYGQKMTKLKKMLLMKYQHVAHVVEFGSCANMCKGGLGGRTTLQTISI